jgi:hypothetical protein
MGDRKYRHRGYMEDADIDYREREERKPRAKLPIDVTGPRLPRMVQTVVAPRCYNCALTLPSGFDFSGTCPRCNVALHCCKQCAYFEPSARFQCLKPIRERIPSKDKANECEWFSPRVTVARDTSSAASSPAVSTLAPRTPEDARAAFDNLFKK